MMLSSLCSVAKVKRHGKESGFLSNLYLLHLKRSALGCSDGQRYPQSMLFQQNSAGDICNGFYG